jgi:hypothetical protein
MVERKNAVIKVSGACTLSQREANTAKRPWHSVPNWPDHVTGDEMVAAVKPVDPDDPDVGDVIADWKQTPGAVGIRIRMTKEAKLDPTDPGLRWTRWASTVSVPRHLGSARPHGPTCRRAVAPAYQKLASFCTAPIGKAP